MDNSIIEIQSEYEKLIEEIHQLKSRIVSLTALRDDLLYHVCPALEAEYEEKIASLERELMAAYLYLNTYRRTIELLQAQINNRRQKVSVEEAEAQAQEEFRQAQEDIHKKAEEAKKSREEWQSGSNWSEYDKETDGQEEKAKEEKSHNSRRESDEEEWERMGREEEKESNSEKNKEWDNGEEQGDNRFINEDQANQQGGGCPGRDESTAAKIKRLYRKIVKRLHPDVHPNPTDREKELLNKAHEAYRKGDLDALEKIWEELAGADAPEDEFKDSPEDIARIKEVIKKLQGLCNDLIRQIQNIKGEFPYTMKAFLEDEEAVAEKRFMLSGELSGVREMCSKLVDEIERLRGELSYGEGKE